MSLTTTCPGCNGKLVVREQLLGQKIQCPTCQTALMIKAPEANPQAPAPSQPANPPPSNDHLLVQCVCSRQLKVPKNLAGRQTRCPKCQALIMIPGASAAQAPSEQSPLDGDDLFSDATFHQPTPQASPEFSSMTPAPQQQGTGFAAPAKSAPPKPAKPRGDWFNAMGSNSFLWVLLLLIGGPIYANYQFQKHLEREHIVETGTLVKGTVVQGYEQESRRRRSRSTSYYLMIAYPTEEGSSESKKFKVNEPFYTAHDIGDSVDVKYLPEDPQSSILPEGSTDTPMLEVAIGLGIGFLGVLGALYTLAVYFLGG